jgi:hypothetical protein
LLQIDILGLFFFPQKKQALLWRGERYVAHILFFLSLLSERRLFRGQKRKIGKWFSGPAYCQFENDISRLYGF